jgi:hypothetical protein
MAAAWTLLGERACKSVQAATEAVPTDPTDGFNIINVFAFSVTVECDVGKTFFDTSGALDLYHYDPIVGAWSRVAYGSLYIPPEAAGLRRFTVPFTIANARGRLAHTRRRSLGSRGGGYEKTSVALGVGAGTRLGAAGPLRADWSEQRPSQPTHRYGVYAGRYDHHLQQRRARK